MEQVSWDTVFAARDLQEGRYCSVGPPGGRSPLAGMGARVTGRGTARDSRWWGQNNTTTRDHKRNPLKILHVQKRDVLAVIYVRF